MQWGTELEGKQRDAGRAAPEWAQPEPAAHWAAPAPSRRQPRPAPKSSAQALLLEGEQRSARPSPAAPPSAARAVRTDPRAPAHPRAPADPRAPAAAPPSALHGAPWTSCPCFGWASMTAAQAAESFHSAGPIWRFVMCHRGSFSF